MTPDMITILGPTASGKTKLAVNVAWQLNGEIISADSRQVYRGMDIGTGKDIDDYFVSAQQVPLHLIDIVDPGYEYNVYEFKKDFEAAYRQITDRKKLPVLCGGTGLYLDAVLLNYKLDKVPVNAAWRESIKHLTDEQLISQLEEAGELHNTTDTTDRDRTVRALEIALYQKKVQKPEAEWPDIDSLNFGISFERKTIRERITARLKQRLENGMINEVENLLQKGLKPDQLTFYGLEYRFVTNYVTGQIGYEEMFEKLNTAIHQFAKRQMTWFRRMEKKGVKIEWLNGEDSVETNVSQIINRYKSLKD